MNLLQQWHDIYQEAVQLSETIERLPDECECGDAEAHLEERCHCCGGHGRAREPHGHGETCTVLLSRLRADLAMLCADFSRVVGPVEAATLGTHRLELRQGIFLASSDLQQIVEALEQVNESVAGFRRTCAVSEMRRVKRHSATLREHCNRLDAELQGD